MISLVVANEQERAHMVRSTYYTCGDHCILILLLLRYTEKYTP